MVPETNVTTEKHNIKVDALGAIREVLNNLNDYRDVIRELLSNCCSKEVGAKNVKISVWGPGKEGYVFICVEDDGCGMNYTKDDNHPGRLDKFLNAAQSAQAGIETDEFGSKGYGTVLLHNSRYVKVETSTGQQEYYEIIFDNPLRALDQGQVLSPEVRTIDTPRAEGKGTEITIMGYANLGKVPKEFNLIELRRYLQYRTVVGYSLPRDEQPNIILSVHGREVTVDTGLPYFKRDPGDKRTKIFGPKEFVKDGVKITIEGGVTMDTKKHDLTDTTGGIFISQRGIPYFTIDGRHKAYKTLGLTPAFLRIMVNCDDVPLNTARSDFNRADPRFKLFESTLMEAINWIKNLSEYRDFIEIQKHDRTVALQKYMDQVKKKHRENKIEYVWFKENRLIQKPAGEYEVAAILWKLESLPDGLPFKKFETVAYPGISKGLDLLVNYQEDETSEYKNLAYVELERRFSSFFTHKHNAKQASALVCWTIDSSNPHSAPLFYKNCDF